MVIASQSCRHVAQIKIKVSAIICYQSCISVESSLTHLSIVSLYRFIDLPLRGGMAWSSLVPYSYDPLTHSLTHSLTHMTHSLT